MTPVRSRRIPGLAHAYFHLSWRQAIGSDVNLPAESRFFGEGGRHDEMSWEAVAGPHCLAEPRRKSGRGPAKFTHE